MNLAVSDKGLTMKFLDSIILLLAVCLTWTVSLPAQNVPLPPATIAISGYDARGYGLPANSHIYNFLSRSRAIKAMAPVVLAQSNPWRQHPLYKYGCTPTVTAGTLYTGQLR